METVQTVRVFGIDVIVVDGLSNGTAYLIKPGRVAFVRDPDKKLTDVEKKAEDIISRMIEMGLVS